MVIEDAFWAALSSNPSPDPSSLEKNERRNNANGFPNYFQNDLANLNKLSVVYLFPLRGGSFISTSLITPRQEN